MAISKTKTKKPLKLHVWQAGKRRQAQRESPVARKKPIKQTTPPKPVRATRGASQRKAYQSRADWLAEVRWNERYNQLKDFKARFGHCVVLQSWHEHGGFGTWVSRLRQRRKDLTATQTDRLNKLGFDWDPKATRWELRFAELRAFHAEFGHARVPLNWPRNRILGRWVSLQRQVRKAKGSLSQARTEKLDSLGFVWATSMEKKWDRRYAELRRFQEKHGHCNVGKKSVLGLWVATQRITLKIGKLSADRKRRLDQLGFRWRLRPARGDNDVSWRNWVEKLKDYERIHGCSDVSFRDERYEKLAWWQNRQRQLRKKGKLRADRVLPAVREAAANCADPKHGPRRRAHCVRGIAARVGQAYADRRPASPNEAR